MVLVPGRSDPSAASQSPEILSQGAAAAFPCCRPLCFFYVLFSSSPAARKGILGLGKKKKKVGGSPGFSRERKIKDQQQGRSPDG